jgi:hypothetical protein
LLGQRARQVDAVLQWRRPLPIATNSRGAPGAVRYARALHAATRAQVTKIRSSWNHRPKHGCSVLGESWRETKGQDIASSRPWRSPSMAVPTPLGPQPGTRAEVRVRTRRSVHYIGRGVSRAVDDYVRKRAVASKYGLDPVNTPASGQWTAVRFLSGNRGRRNASKGQGIVHGPCWLLFATGATCQFQYPDIKQAVYTVKSEVRTLPAVSRNAYDA